MKRIPVELGPVQQTLLIPLLGRAEETRRSNGMLRDHKAVEIVESLDYDFDKWRGGRSLGAASLRTRMFDGEVEAFLAAHPQGTVVELGAGLNTRYERLDNGKAQWLELDLPDAMALRRQFFADSSNRKMIAGSLTETDWHAKVLELPGPYCFVSEAVMIYLENPQAERAVRALAASFPGAWLVTDTVAKRMIDSQDKHDAMKVLPKASWFRWACDDPKRLEQWGLTLERSRSFLDAPAALIDRLPLVDRFFFRYLRWAIRGRVEGYRINRFHLPTTAAK